MPVSNPKYKNLFCQTLKKWVLTRGFLLYVQYLLAFPEYRIITDIVYQAHNQDFMGGGGQSGSNYRNVSFVVSSVYLGKYMRKYMRNCSGKVHSKN